MPGRHLVPGEVQPSSDVATEDEVEKQRGDGQASSPTVAADTTEETAKYASETMSPMQEFISVALMCSVQLTTRKNDPRANLLRPLKTRSDIPILQRSVLPRPSHFCTLLAAASASRIPGS